VGINREKKNLFFFFFGCGGWGEREGEKKRFTSK
jgi:hypothetical protein